MIPKVSSLQRRVNECSDDTSTKNQSVWATLNPGIRIYILSSSSHVLEPQWLLKWTSSPCDVLLRNFYGLRLRVHKQKRGQWSWTESKGHIRHWFPIVTERRKHEIILPLHTRYNSSATIRLLCEISLYIITTMNNHRLSGEQFFRGFAHRGKKYR